MFWGCNKLKELKEIKNFNTEKVTNMMEMFYFCSSLEKLDLSKFAYTNVTNMVSIFALCSSLKTLEL